MCNSIWELYKSDLFVTKISLICDWIKKCVKKIESKSDRFNSSKLLRGESICFEPTKPQIYSNFFYSIRWNVYEQLLPILSRYKSMILTIICKYLKLFHYYKTLKFWFISFLNWESLKILWIIHIKFVSMFVSFFKKKDFYNMRFMDHIVDRLWNYSLKVVLLIYLSKHTN